MNVMMEGNNQSGAQRRRSPRLSAPPPGSGAGNKMSPVKVKRSIAVRKIVSRKTAGPSEQKKENKENQENTPRRRSQRNSPQVSTPGPTPGLSLGRAGSSSAEKKKKAAVLSPILASSPPALSAQDAVWSHKVRRSYSRLGDTSFSPPDSRDHLFGFGSLQTPKVAPRVVRPKADLEASCGPESGLNSFMAVLEAEDCSSAGPEPDLNIPGVVMEKKTRTRRKKVQLIGTTEMDALAAQLNAEHEEAEEFELLVE